MLAPLGAFVIALSSVRTRRSSANVAMLGAIVALLSTLLVGWGLARRTTAFLATYPYINLPVAFSGPVNFQSFGIDITLRVDHVTVAALVVVEVCTIGALAWHSVMGRSEPGPARFHALISGLLFSCVGILVSWDLAELLAFWGLAGGVTYLLLAHRWGSDEPAGRARIAMALPFVTDLSLFCGVAWLYARYGVQNLNTLIPILHTNPGWTVRSLVVASILLFIGVAGRLAIWPVQSWMTQTAVTAPPAASALVQAVWPVVAIVVLYRVMPIFAASNLQTMQYALYACGAAAVIAPVLAFATNEPRRIIALVGSGVAAIGAAVVIHGSEKTGFTFAVAGVACVLAAAPAREAAALAASAIAGTMRTDDLAEMGDALRRLRAASVTLLIAALVIGLSASGALAFAVASRSRLGVVLADAVVLIALGVLRVFLAMAIGPLRRRRAFEPDRIRKIPDAANNVTYWLVLAGAALLIASLIHGWLDFLDGHKHPTPSIGSYLIWAAVAALGFAAAALAYTRDKDSALRASALPGAWLDARLNTVWSTVDRFLVAPVTDVASRSGDGIAAGDDRVGRATTAAGRLAAAATNRAPATLVILLAVLLAILLGVVSPGILR
jgi:NADH:ubiquinone oxidoreductase subunit 5 (subunit L)/multisubunit Na+/H+ antiporter MnhA subunit